MGGFFSDGRGMGIQTQELAALGSQGFGGVGEKAEMANSHKPMLRLSMGIVTRTDGCNGHGLTWVMQ